MMGPTYSVLTILCYTSRDKGLLNNEKRRLILSYIGEHPGEHYRRIKRELNIASGTLRHHLRRLEEAEMIRSERVGKYRHFYPICKN